MHDAFPLLTAALCWGSNQDGKLGSGPSSNAIISAVPTPVAEPADDTSAWVQLSTGDAHACGVKASGRLYCWGACPNPCPFSWLAPSAGWPQQCWVMSVGVHLHDCAACFRCAGSNRDGRLGTAAVPVGGSTNAPVEVLLPGGMAAAPSTSAEGAPSAPGAAPAPAGGLGDPAPFQVDPGSSASVALPTILVLAGSLLAVLATGGRGAAEEGRNSSSSKSPAPFLGPVHNKVSHCFFLYRCRALS
jgi:hypothetical protein